MSKFNRKVLCRSVSLALAMPVVAGLLPAQMAQAAVEEVIVTARKTDENVQEVPTAITALTSNDLRDLQINNFSQVGQTVPNLNIQTQFGSASAPQFFMRGIASGTLRFQADSGIGLYIDGVYLGRPAGTAFDLADIASVEVLRGPQGSVFGRNSTGGAINIITAEPTGEFGGHVEAGFGNYGSKRQKATLNLPEYLGFSTRVTVLHNETDGWAKNNARTDFLFTSPFGEQKSAHRFGMEDTSAVSFALDYTGVDKLKLSYRFDYTDKASTQTPVQQIVSYGTGFPFVNGVGGVSGVPTPSTKRQTSLSEDFLSDSKLRILGHSLTAQYEFTDNLSIKNILAYRELNENVGMNDIDGGAITTAGVPTMGLASIQDRSQDQWSDELQLFGSTDTVDWIIGAFFFKETGADNNPVFLPGTQLAQGTPITPSPAAANYIAGANAKIENKSKSAFAHGTWHATDELDFSGGLRYSKDDRYENILAAGLIGVVPGFDPITNKAAFHHTDYDLSATYKIAPDFNVYGKVSTGYLSGGTLAGTEFKPETIKSYEIGAKSQFLDNTLRVNLSAFRNTRQHLQTLQFNIVNGTFISDGGESTERGFELEVTAAPIEALTLTANYGHVSQEVDGGTRSLAPKNNAYLAAQYEVWKFENASHVDFRIDGIWTDKHYQTPCVTSSGPLPTGGCSVPTDATAKDVVTDANWLIGARLSLVDLPINGNSKGRISLWGKNLTNSDKIEFAKDVGNNVIVGSFQTPRTYGVDFSVDF